MKRRMTSWMPICRTSDSSSVNCKINTHCVIQKERLYEKKGKIKLKIELIMASTNQYHLY
jgi:hypothetical protein